MGRVAAPERVLSKEVWRGGRRPLLSKFICLNSPRCDEFELEWERVRRAKSEKESAPGIASMLLRRRNHSFFLGWKPAGVEHRDGHGK